MKTTYRAMQISGKHVDKWHITHRYNTYFSGNRISNANLVEEVARESHIVLASDSEFFAQVIDELVNCANHFMFSANGLEKID